MKTNINQLQARIANLLITGGGSFSSDFGPFTGFECHEPSGLLRQSPDWRSEEDDRQVATCPQLGNTNRLEHAQVRPGTHSFPAKSATLAGCCRPGSVQSLRPGVQMSAQDGS